MEPALLRHLCAYFTDPPGSKASVATGVGVGGTMLAASHSTHRHRREGMSLLNAWVSKERALVAVDTQGLDQTGLRYPFSKLIPLAHATTVFASRGDRMYLAQLFRYYYLARDPATASDYDGIVASAPSALASVNQDCRDNAGPDTFFHVVIVGWSPTRGRVAGMQYTGTTFSDEIESRPLERVISPADCISEPQTPADHGSMLRLARLQAPWLNAQGHPGGGDLVIAEIRKQRIEITSRPI